MDELACTECMWTGDFDDIDSGGYFECPKCGAKPEPIDNDYLPEEKPFNWNKK